MDSMQLQALQLVSQKEIERGFAAVVSRYPLYAIQQCGWLRPYVLMDDGVRKFWSLLQDRLDLSMNDEQGATAVTQSALESGVSAELFTWERMLLPDATPQGYAVEISRRAYLVKVTNTMGELWKALQAGDDLDAREIISKLSTEHPAAGDEIPSMAAAADEFIQLLDNPQISQQTFIPPLDIATGGLEKSTLTLIAGRPGMGKSALGLQIARSVAESGKKVIFFSLEMSKAGILARMACPIVGLIWRDVLAGRVSKADIERLKQAARDIGDRLDGKLYIPDTRQTTETIWRTVASMGPDVVLIDHLRLIKDQGENENKRQGRISENLHDMSKAFSLPVVCLVQLNRAVEKQQDKRPNLSDLRDSGEIEENCDNAWMLYRDSYYSQDGKPPLSEPVELWVRKFRNGPANIQINMIWKGKEQWFEAKRS